MLLRLALPVAAIVLLGLYMADRQGPYLMLGLLCSNLGIWLNLWLQRRERKAHENE